MADIKISSLASATSITGTDLVPVVQTGANKKATLSVVKDYVIADSSLLKDTAIGVTVQGYDAELTSWAAIAPSAKQDTLVSGTNIKTINGSSLLGAGDLTISGGGTPGGSSGQVQFNNAGAFGGANLYFSTNLLEQRNGPSQPQNFRIYNTYTDASNFERAKFAWESNSLVIGTEKLGTGLDRSIQFKLSNNTTPLSIGAAGGLVAIGAFADILYATGNITATGLVKGATLRTSTAYTVATLPTDRQAGRRAYVTDALSPTYLAAVTGGGTVVCPVFDNGTQWIVG